MSTAITTCKGESCQRRCECLRCIEYKEHDVKRLCYAGFTFFLHNLPIQVFDEDADD